MTSSISVQGNTNQLPKTEKQNKLEKELKIIDLNPQTAEQVKKSLKISFKEPKGIKKFLAHIFRLPIINNNRSFGFNWRATIYAIVISVI